MRELLFLGAATDRPYIVSIGGDEHLDFLDETLEQRRIIRMHSEVKSHTVMATLERDHVNAVTIWTIFECTANHCRATEKEGKSVVGCAYFCPNISFKITMQQLVDVCSFVRHTFGESLREKSFSRNTEQVRSPSLILLLLGGCRGVRTYIIMQYRGALAYIVWCVHTGAIVCICAYVVQCVRKGVYSTVHTYGRSTDTGVQIYRYGLSTFLLPVY